MQNVYLVIRNYSSERVMSPSIPLETLMLQIIGSNLGCLLARIKTLIQSLDLFIIPSWKLQKITFQFSND